MKPINFPEANRVLKAPEGMTPEECGELPVLNDGTTSISLWELEDEEREAIIKGGRVVLSVMAGMSQPPVSLGVMLVEAQEPAPKPKPKRTLRRYVHEAEEMPKGYGAAYYDWFGQVRVAYPIGINLLVRWARELYWAIARYHKSTVDEAFQIVYYRGMVVGGLQQYLQHMPECVRHREEIGCTCGLDRNLGNLEHIRHIVEQGEKDAK